jgi:hypothetical protein
VDDQFPPFTPEENGSRVTVMGQWGVLEFPIIDPGPAGPEEAIVWYDKPLANGWKYEYVLPIDVTDRKKR